MTYYLVLASDGYITSFRGIYDSMDKALVRGHDLEQENLDFDIVEFDELNQAQNIDFVLTNM